MQIHPFTWVGNLQYLSQTPTLAIPSKTMSAFLRYISARQRAISRNVLILMHIDLRIDFTHLCSWQQHHSRLFPFQPTPNSITTFLLLISNLYTTFTHHQTPLEPATKQSGCSRPSTSGPSSRSANCITGGGAGNELVSCVLSLLFHCTEYRSLRWLVRSASSSLRCRQVCRMPKARAMERTRTAMPRMMRGIR